MKNFARHLPHYLTLLGLLTMGAIGFIFFSYDRIFQIGVSIALAISYVVWGVVHHYLHRDLHLTVLIEYVVVATLGLVIVFSLIFRA